MLGVGPQSLIPAQAMALNITRCPPPSTLTKDSQIRWGRRGAKFTDPRRTGVPPPGRAPWTTALPMAYAQHT